MIETPRTPLLLAEASVHNLRDASRAPHRRALRLRVLNIVGAAYAINSLLISLAASLDIVEYRAVLYGACGGLLHYTVFRFLFLRGAGENGRDSFLAIPQCVLAFTIVLGSIVLWPTMAGYMVGVLPLIFCFGVMSMRWPLALAMWAMVSAVLIWALETSPAGLRLATSTPAQRLFTDVFFPLLLLCYVGVGLLGSQLRLALYQRNRSLAAASARIEQLASHDELTGALTRRAVTAQLDLELGRAARRENGLAVALLDLDHFKSINDRHGHAAGDTVLRGFAELVSSATRSIDLFGRYGGEEFLLVLVDTPAESAMALLERVRLLVANRDWSEAAPGLQVTVSMGLAQFRPGESSAELVRRADLALYRAKDGGRNRVMLAD